MIAKIACILWSIMTVGYSATLPYEIVAVGFNDNDGQGNSDPGTPEESEDNRLEERAEEVEKSLLEIQVAAAIIEQVLQQKRQKHTVKEKVSDVIMLRNDQPEFPNRPRRNMMRPLYMNHPQGTVLSTFSLGKILLARIGDRKSRPDKKQKQRRHNSSKHSDQKYKKYLKKKLEQEFKMRMII